MNSKNIIFLKIKPSGLNVLKKNGQIILYEIQVKSVRG